MGSVLPFRVDVSWISCAPSIDDVCYPTAPSAPRSRIPDKATGRKTLHRPYPSIRMVTCEFIILAMHILAIICGITI